MASLLDRIEAADALVLGAPVNFGDINALTRKFLERTVCYGYWPWNSPAPIRSSAKPTKKAVLVRDLRINKVPFILGDGFGKTSTSLLKSITSGTAG